MTKNFAVFLVTALFLVLTRAQATNNWVAGCSDFYNGTCWSDGVPPNATTYAVIDDSNANLLISKSFSCRSLTINNINWFNVSSGVIVTIDVLSIASGSIYINSATFANVTATSNITVTNSNTALYINGSSSIWVTVYTNYYSSVWINGNSNITNVWNTDASNVYINGNVAINTFYHTGYNVSVTGGSPSITNFTVDGDEEDGGSGTNTVFYVSSGVTVWVETFTAQGSAVVVGGGVAWVIVKGWFYWNDAYLTNWISVVAWNSLLGQGARSLADGATFTNNGTVWWTSGEIDAGTLVNNATATNWFINNGNISCSNVTSTTYPSCSFFGDTPGSLNVINNGNTNCTGQLGGCYFDNCNIQNIGTIWGQLTITSNGDEEDGGDIVNIWGVSNYTTIYITDYGTANFYGLFFVTSFIVDQDANFNVNGSSTIYTEFVVLSGSITGYNNGSFNAYAIQLSSSAIFYNFGIVQVEILYINDDSIVYAHGPIYVDSCQMDATEDSYYGLFVTALVYIQTFNSSDGNVNGNGGGSVLVAGTFTVEDISITNCTFTLGPNCVATWGDNDYDYTIYLYGTAVFITNSTFGWFSSSSFEMDPSTTFVNNGEITIVNPEDIDFNGGGQIINNGNITVSNEGGFTIESSASFFQCPRGALNLVLQDPNYPPVIYLYPSSGASTLYMDGEVNVIIPNNASNTVGYYFSPDGLAYNYITVVDFTGEGDQGNQAFAGRVTFNVVGGGGYPYAFCLYTYDAGYGQVIIYNPLNYNPAAVDGYTCVGTIPNVTTNIYCDNVAQPPPYVNPPFAPVAPTSAPPQAPTAPTAPTVPVPVAPQAPTAPTAPTVAVPTGPVAPHAPTAPTVPVPSGPSSKPNVIPPTAPSSSSLLTGSFVLLLLCFSALFI